MTTPDFAKIVPCCIAQQGKTPVQCPFDQYQGSTECDEYMKQYCSIFYSSKECSCLAASDRGWKSPQCFHKTCATEGYRFPQHRVAVCPREHCTENEKLPSYKDELNETAISALCYSRETEPSPAIKAAFKKTIDTTDMRVPVNPIIGPKPEYGGECQGTIVCGNKDAADSLICGPSLNWYDDVHCPRPAIYDLVPGAMAGLLHPLIWILLYFIVVMAVVVLIALTVRKIRGDSQKSKIEFRDGTLYR